MQEKILITGASGFFGSHLVRRIGAKALTPGRRELELLDAGSVQRYLESNRPVAIVHAAGVVGGIELNVRHPGRMALDNLKMGLHLLDAVARLGNIHVVLISTICVYPSGAPVPMAETCIYDGYPAQATAPYGLAKRELLSLAEALRAEFHLDFSYVIPTNLYGPGDHFDEAKSHVVPALIQRMYEAAKCAAPYIEVWGDGKATRDLLYVEDAAEAIVQVLQTGPHPLPINIGSGREVSIRELAETIKGIIGYQGEIRWDTSKPVGATRRVLDISRARQCFGFDPHTSLKDGLCKSIDWYVNHVSKVTE
jgi:GDP-L-fucose synthase